MRRSVIPGWQGSPGPFPGQYQDLHAYARDVNSDAGKCVCGWALQDGRHVQAAPNVPVPSRLRGRGRDPIVNVEPVG